MIGWRRWVPGLQVISRYQAAWLPNDLMAGLVLTTMLVPVGIAYAIWSGAGIVLVSLIGLALYGQKLDVWAMVGIGLIIAGVMVINLLSKSTAH